MPARRYVEENGLAAMLATKRSAGVAPEVNLRKCIRHIPLPSVNKAADPGFETQRRCRQKSKTGVSVAPQKGLMSLVIYSQKRITEKLGTSLPSMCQMHIGKLSFMNFSAANITYISCRKETHSRWRKWKEWSPKKSKELNLSCDERNKQ